MAGIRIIEHTGDRIETGPLQVGDDWPGLFIRGDNAVGLFMQLSQVDRMLRCAPVSVDPLGLGRAGILCLRRLLASCVLGDAGERLREKIDEEGSVQAEGRTVGGC